MLTSHHTRLNLNPASVPINTSKTKPNPTIVIVTRIPVAADEQQHEYQQFLTILSGTSFVIGGVSGYPHQTNDGSHYSKQVLHFGYPLVIVEERV
jgi:hypothetical protein